MQWRTGAGARAWDRLRRDLAARGESLDPRDFIPPPVPDDQNLALAPIFVRTFRYKTDPGTGLLTFDPQAYENNPTARTLENLPYGKKNTNIDQPSQHGSWQSGHRADLAAWQTFYRKRDEFPRPTQPGAPAEDVAQALSYYDGLLDEVARAAAERPLARWPINYTKRPSYAIALSHVNVVQRLQRTLRLRACARLALGQTAAAHRDVELMFRLNDSLANEPILISALVRSNGVNLLLQPIWEGLLARQWSADDLQAWQEKLRGVELLRHFQQGVRGGECAMFLARLPDELQDWHNAREIQKSFPLMNDGPLDGTARWLWSFLPVLPRGWYVQNAAGSCRLLQEGLIDTVDPAGQRVFPAKSESLARRLTATPTTPYNFLTRITLPSLQHVPTNLGATQAAAGQASAACALERYWLDHHAYPDRLDALVPAYLDRVPHDLIDGAPLRYRQTSDGRYQLWSIGWDGRDEGGSIAWPADRKWRGGAAGGPLPYPNPEKTTGDWVWQYAPAEPPDPPANRSRLE